MPQKQSTVPFAWLAAVLGMLVSAESFGQSAPAAAPPAGAPTAKASTVSIAPSQIDFGVIKPGSRQKGEFKIQNKGTTAVKIESAFPSCKCTTISDLAGKEIPAGGEIDLIASLDAPRTPGPKDAKVFVTIAGDPQPLIAKMQGDVQLPLLVQPTYIDALKGKMQGVVEISSPNGTPFHVLSCDGATPVFAGFDPAKDAPQSSYRLRWDFSMVPDGKMQQWWCVETDVADCPIVPFRIRHESTGLRFDPKMDERRWFIPEAIVVAGKIALNKPVELEMELESSVAKGKPQPAGWDAVRGLKSPSPDVAVEVISSKRDGDRVRVQFRFTVTKSAGGFLYAPVTITTDTGTARFFVAATVSP
ncbi:MAG: DUF1573 domain-containing protein [Planctomycetes bacterium]|nr:DUF1573 domain-containing protein [Planctomycetota bacterium]